MDSYMGTIMAWAPNFVPRSWMYCQGQTLSINSNTALFSLIGTVYGGNGVTTFQLPNLSGRVAVGAGPLAGGSTYVIGQTAGTEQVSLTIGQLPQHIHAASLTSITINASNGDATDHNPSSTANVIAGPYDTVNGVPFAGFNGGPANTPLGVAGSGGVTVAPTGNNLPVSILQPYLAVNYIICTQGIFPPRN